MASIKVLNGEKRHHNPDARQLLINYILNPNKAESGLAGYAYTHPIFPAESMNHIAQKYNKDSGIRIHHFILAFEPDELDDPEIANDIAWMITTYIAASYQTVFAVHEDRPHLHIHFAFNSVSYVDGHRYYGKKAEYYALISAVKQALHAHGLHALYEVSSKSENDIQDE